MATRRPLPEERAIIDNLHRTEPPPTHTRYFGIELRDHLGNFMRPANASVRSATEAINERIEAVARRSYGGPWHARLPR